MSKTDPLPQETAPLSEAAVRDMLARAEAATPGPWYRGTDLHFDKPVSECVTCGELAMTRMYRHVAEIDVDQEGCYGFLGADQCRVNMDFIAAARTDLPALARECLRLRAAAVERDGLLRDAAESLEYFCVRLRDRFPSVVQRAAAVAARVRAHLHPTETPDA